MLINEESIAMYFKHIKINILNEEYWVDVLLGDKEKSWKLIRKWHKDADKEWIFSNRGFNLYNNGEIQNPTIWVGLHPKDEHFYATIAHEAVHAIDHIYDLINEKTGREVFAHCVGAVVAKVEDWVKKKCP